MPAKSKKQYKLMAGVMAGSIKGSGVPKKVAEEFVNATGKTKKSQFSRNLRKQSKNKER